VKAEMPATRLSISINQSVEDEQPSSIFQILERLEAVAEDLMRK
jgi:hypothetical protein